MKKLKYFKGLYLDKMKCLLAALMLIFLLIPLASAVYEVGDKVTYSVVCLDNNGARDTGCGTNASYVYDSQFVTRNISHIVEVSDAQAPGLWAGDFTIPSTFANGTASIYIQLSNVNGTASGTVLHFQIVDHGFGDIQTNFSGVEGDIFGLANVSTSDIDTYCDTASDVDTTLTSSHGSGAWTTADLLTLSNLTATEVWAYAIRLITGGNLTTPADYKADVSALATSVEVGIVNGTILGLANVTTSDLDTECVSQAEMDTDHGIGFYNTTGECATSAEVTSVNDTVKATNDLIMADIGIFGRWDQSLAAMLGYNVSDGSVETDLDAAGGTSPEAVWTYANRNLTFIDFLVFGNWNVFQKYMWNYTLREITGGNLTTPADYKADVSVLATSAEVGIVNDSVLGLANLTRDEVAEEVGLVNDSVLGLANLTAEEVWTHSERNLTNGTSIAADIWGYTTRTLSSLNFNILTAWDLLQNYIWNASSRELTQDNASVIMENITAEHSLTKTNVSGEHTVTKENITAEHSLTKTLIDTNTSNIYSQIITVYNYLVNPVYSYLTGVVVPAIKSNATDIKVNISDEHALTRTQISDNATDIMENVSGEHTETRSWLAGLANITASDVWGYASRTLTWINFNTFGNWSTIQSYVWNETVRLITGGNLTTPSDYKADVSALATSTEVTSVNDTLKARIESLANVTISEVWAYATREITGGNLSTPDDYKADITALANLTAAEVWAYAAREITGGNLSTPADYKADVTTLANVTVQEIWEYATRLITGGNLTTPDNYKADLSTLANLTSNQVWDYNISVNRTAGIALDYIYNNSEPGGY